MLMKSQCYADMLGDLRSLDTYEGKQLTWQCPVKVSNIDGYVVRWLYQGDQIGPISEDNRRSGFNL